MASAQWVENQNVAGQWVLSTPGGRPTDTVLFPSAITSTEFQGNVIVDGTFTSTGSSTFVAPNANPGGGFTYTTGNALSGNNAGGNFVINLGVGAGVGGNGKFQVFDLALSATYPMLVIGDKDTSTVGRNVSIGAGLRSPQQFGYFAANLYVDGYYADPTATVQNINSQVIMNLSADTTNLIESGLFTVHSGAGAYNYSTNGLCAIEADSYGEVVGAKTIVALVGIQTFPQVTATSTADYTLVSGLVSGPGHSGSGTVAIMRGLTVSASLGTNSLANDGNITTLECMTTTINNNTANAGGYGVITNGWGYYAGQPNLSTHGVITTIKGIEIQQQFNTNGHTSTTGGYAAYGLYVNMPDQGGNTSGTNTNYGLLVTGTGGASGASGTVNNFGIEIIVPSAVASGINNNYGLYIHGAGGSGGTTTNWAIFSDSTAPTSIGTSSAGAISFAAGANSSWVVTGGSITLQTATSGAINFTPASGSGVAVTTGGFTVTAGGATISAGHLGISTAQTTTDSLIISEQYTDPAGSTTGANITYTSAINSDNSQTQYGLSVGYQTNNSTHNWTGSTRAANFVATYQGLSTGTIGALVGVNATSQTTTATTGAVTNAIGMGATINHFGTGTMATAYGVQAQVLLRPSGGATDGAITQGSALYARLQNLSNDATPGVFGIGYGLFCDSPSFGSGSPGAITTIYGGRVFNQGTAHSTFAIGFQVDVQANATNNTSLAIGTTTTGQWGFYSNTTNASKFFGDVLVSNGATNATGGFIYIPAAAGAPTGTPTNKGNGLVPLQYDTTNKVLAVYDNVAGAWYGITLLTSPL